MKESSSDSDLRRTRASLTDSDISDAEELNRDLVSSFDSHTSSEENSGDSVLQQGTSGSADAGIDIPNRNLDFTPTTFKFDQYDGANDSSPKFSPFSFSSPNSPTITEKNDNSAYQNNLTIPNTAPKLIWLPFLDPRTEGDIKFVENLKVAFKEQVFLEGINLIENKLTQNGIRSENITKILNLAHRLIYDVLIDNFAEQLYTLKYDSEMREALFRIFPGEIPKDAEIFGDYAVKLAHLFIDDHRSFKENQRNEIEKSNYFPFCPRFPKTCQLLDKLIRESNQFSNQLANNYLKKIPFYAELSFKNYALEYAKEYFNATLPNNFLSLFSDKIKPYLYTLSEDTLTGAFYAIRPSHSYAQPVQFDLQLSNADQTILKAHSKEILDALCIEHFLADGQNTTTSRDIINKLKNNFIGLGLPQANLNHEPEIINNVFDKVSNEVLNETNIKKALAIATNDNNPHDSRSLIDRIRDQLQAWTDQKVNTAINSHMPRGNPDDLTAILNRIFVGDPLSNTALQALLQAHPSLQYANNEEEFSSALSAIYPSADYPGVIYPADFTVSNELFIRARQLLRKQALEKIRVQYPEALGDVDAEDIDILATMPWLAAKCRLISGKSITLELDTTEQENFNRQSQRLFHLSELNLAAVTHKSITELKKELEKLATLKLKLVTQAQQHLVEIESKLLDYPKLIDLEDFEANLNAALTDLSFSDENHAAFQVDTGQAQVLLQGIDRHIAHLDNDWGLFKCNAPQALAATGINALSQELHQRIAPYKNKWNLLLLNPLVEKIYTDIKPTFALTPNLSESKAKNLIVTAINLLRSCHQLKEKLEERAEWSKHIKHRYALLEKNQTCRDKIVHRMAIFEEMKIEKEALLTNNNFVANSIPGPTYLPSHCYDLHHPVHDLAVGAKQFNRREALKVGESITYRQYLASEKQPQEWSVMRNNTHSLGYRTEKSAWYRQPSEAMQKEVTFTQMIDAVNSFKDNKEIYFNFGPTCSQAAEVKYRLFISAYNELRQESGEGPHLRCWPNVKLKMPTTAAVTAVKEEIKHKLALYAHERVAIDKNLSTYSRNRG